MNRRSLIGRLVGGTIGGAALTALADIKAHAQANKGVGERCQEHHQCAGNLCCGGRCLGCGSPRREPYCNDGHGHCCVRGEPKTKEYCAKKF